MIDLGQYDARKSATSADEGVFARHRERMSQLLAERPKCITDFTQCQPGRLYAEMINDWDPFHGEEYQRAERLLWATGSGVFFDSDSDEKVTPNCDYLVEQVGAFNLEYVDKPA